MEDTSSIPMDEVLVTADNGDDPCEDSRQRHFYTSTCPLLANEYWQVTATHQRVSPRACYCFHATIVTCPWKRKPKFHGEISSNFAGCIGIELSAYIDVKLYKKLQVPTIFNKFCTLTNRFKGNSVQFSE
ncbi:hypothetical protein J6590_064947 [Homalodisca vitripennis]|nr:hypothetical protein J6590_064947 [Homalodisca vitripennis]